MLPRRRSWRVSNAPLLDGFSISCDGALLVGESEPNVPI